MEELDAVVLGWVVRGRDDAAEIEREQRNGRCRQDAAEDCMPAGRDDTTREGVLELGPRAPRVTADEDAAVERPQGRGAAELLDELACQILADDSSNAVGSEV